MSKLSKFRILPYSERPKSVISGNLWKNGYVWASQWPISCELKKKFDPSLDRSWSEFFKIIKNHGPKNPTRGLIWVIPGLVACQKKKWRLSYPVWKLSMSKLRAIFILRKGIVVSDFFVYEFRGALRTFELRVLIVIDCPKIAGAKGRWQ